MIIFKRLFRKRKKTEIFSKLLKDMRSDSFTEYDYEEIYRGDKDAIKQAKASWMRAGEQVIESMEKLK